MSVDGTVLFTVRIAARKHVVSAQETPIFFSHRALDLVKEYDGVCEHVF